ncbi:MAG: thioredoxin-dependent thiol peroxidase [Candidatus Woesearchaeota archaeon]
MLKENDKAPDFELYDQNNKLHKLSNYNDKTLVLYFYPKDMTPGCTTEACNFRDDYSEFEKKDIVILGVSNDSVESHKKFAEKHKLNFPLLADVDKKVSIVYGVYGQKKFMGKIFNGINRTTFIIKEGVIKKIYPKVDVSKHSKEILKDIDKI